MKLKFIILISVLSAAINDSISQISGTLDFGTNGADAVVISGAATEAVPFGGYTNFGIYYTDTRRTYLSMDFSSIPTNAIITSATLNLYAYNLVNAGNLEMRLRRLSASWVESTITWLSQPSSGSFISADQKDFTLPASPVVGWQSFDIKSHVQTMVTNPALNKGWVLTLKAESGATRGVSWYSSDYSSLKPYISYTYVLPIEISGAVSHCTSGVDNGAVDNISITNGTGVYSSYQWFRINAGAETLIESGTNMSNIDVSSLPDGLYVLSVLDNLNNRGYQYFIVGEYGATTTVQFRINTTTNTYSALFNEDARVTRTVAGNYGDGVDGASTSAEAYTSTSQQMASLMKFKVQFDPLFQFTQAQLYLFSSGHYTNASPATTNEGRVYRNTANWEETTVSWNSKPGTTATDAQIINATTPAGTVTRNDIINMLPFVNYWQANPTQNYGVTIILKTYAQAANAYLRYRSSDYLSNSLRPNFVLTFSMGPQPQIYFELSEQPTGSFYPVPGDDILRVKYQEEYVDSDLRLTYYMRNSNGAIVRSHVNEAKAIVYGDNRLNFNVSSLTAGYYTLEVINEKNEKWYLRFKVV